MAAPTATTGLALGPGDPPLTVAEVAEHYRMTERQLRKIIRDKTVEVLRYGHTVRFDRHALLSLEEALRCQGSREPVSGSSSAMTAAGSGRLRAGSRASAYENALRLTTAGSRRKKPPASKPNSSDPNGTGRVVALNHLPRQ